MTELQKQDRTADPVLIQARDDEYFLLHPSLFL